MAARSDEPAKRCARPQSLSTSVAGRGRASMSEKTSIAAERRAEGVMITIAPARSLRFLKPLHCGEPPAGRRIVASYPAAQFLDRLGQIADMDTLRRFAGAHAFEHAAQQIVVLFVAVGF